MKPLITALIDTYNHERYIEQALVSAVEQGLSPSELEIIVVDDGSTDNTPSIIQKFVPRVKHLRKKNGGQASAFNAGFSQARGQIIAPLDGDDWWAKGKLETVTQALGKNAELEAISHPYYEFCESTGELKSVGPTEPMVLNLGTPERARAVFPVWKFLATGALTVRRSLLERVMPMPEALTFSADSVMATASMALGVLVLSGPPLFHYRLHANNLYAVPDKDSARLRRRYEMEDTMCSVLWPMLLRLGVCEKCVEALLGPFWVWVNEQNRENLRRFGGSRWKTLQTEMRNFRLMHRNPSTAYLMFKYLLMAPATLLLPPREFYKLRDWYWQRNLGQVRNWLFRSERK
jgi:glycosyltransferase involved in cell wall biosynthesis